MENENKTEKVSLNEEKGTLEVNTLEKRCIKCNSLIDSSNKYCTVCGANNTVNLKPKKKKNKKKIDFKTYQLVVLSSVITLIICLGLSFGLILYLNENDVSIDTSNKNVTIDDTGIADAVEKVYDSVVVVENHVNGQTYATGSGFIYDTDNKYGYILTNSHVLTNATEAYVIFTDEEKVKAEVVGIEVSREK